MIEATKRKTRDVPSNDQICILVTGITSLKMGAMEKDNLGNFIIVESMFRSLRGCFPDAQIHTTLQLSNDFAARYRLAVLKNSIFWIYSASKAIYAAWDVVVASIWRMIGIRKSLPRLLGSRRLRALAWADVVVDFSGDMFGDNALNRSQFFIGATIPLTSRALRKEVLSVGSSPGPFSTLSSLAIAKIALRRFDLIAVREPASLVLLNGIGLSGKKLVMYPCFSFGFRPYDGIEESELRNKEPQMFAISRNIVGMIISNHNMQELPPHKWPRDSEEFDPFVVLLVHLVRVKKLKVFLLSHRQAANAAGLPRDGSDHCIVEQLRELLPPDVRKSVLTLNGTYDASTMNRLIGQCEVLISGRVHGAVQGIMQEVPTMIMDYALPPRAHKSLGFAMLAHLLEFLCDPTDSENMIAVFDRLWDQKVLVRERLRERMPKLVRDGASVWERIETRPGRGE